METRRRTPAVTRLQMDHTQNTSTQRVFNRVAARL